MEREEAVDRFPLAWPVGWVRTQSHKRKRAQFTSGSSFDRRVTLAVAIDRLERQLAMMGARNPTMSTNVRLGMRGQPLSNQSEPTDPGAAVYFPFKGKATVLACDKYNRVADNVAAIAAHVDALRRIERYGVGTIEQALAGYKALPSDTAADWRSVFGFGKDQVVTTAMLDTAFKEAARLHHPDRGGSEDKMSQVNRAREFAQLEIGQ
jgi:hypothetical protein